MTGVPPSLRDGMASLIFASLANSTWKKYGSAWAALDDYQTYIMKELQWPLSKETLRGYVVYLITVRRLKMTSARAYLSSLACLHRLKGFPNHQMDDNVVRTIMRGPRIYK